MSALARWDGFLAQIAGRHDQVRAEAEASARAFIAQVATGGDPLPLSHQLMAVKSRLQDLETSIIDTWHAKVDAAFAAENQSPEVRARGYELGNALKHRLDDAREELEIRIMAELARCRMANGVPDGVAIATHPVSQEIATAEWRAMRAAERAMHAIRPPRPLDAVMHYERAQIAYWRRYLTARSQFEPILARDPALEIRSRMHHWYVSAAEYEEAWVQAGRPRTPI